MVDMGTQESKSQTSDSVLLQMRLERSAKILATRLACDYDTKDRIEVLTRLILQFFDKKNIEQAQQLLDDL